MPSASEGSNRWSMEQTTRLVRSEVRAALALLYAVGDDAWGYAPKLSDGK
jgi:hypothetical protein